jgi:hypothetical protein
MIKFFFNTVYPLGLFIIFMNPDLDLYIPNFDFYSWNFMYYWIIYIIPILYYLYFIYSHNKEIVFEFKDNKVYKKFKEEEWKFSVLNILLFLFLLPTGLILTTMLVHNVLNGIKLKNMFSYFIIISYITFFISIFLFYFRVRFTGSSLFQIELLSGDVFFLIIPFILSSVIVFNQEFKKLDE